MAGHNAYRTSIYSENDVVGKPKSRWITKAEGALIL